MHPAKQIIIAIVVIVLAVMLYNVAVTIPSILDPPVIIGDVEYQPIDELPKGQPVLVLTEEDFAKHPAFSVIFDEENQWHNIYIVFDVTKEGNPEPNISEREGYELLNEYPYVEYNGQLYKCLMTIA